MKFTTKLKQWHDDFTCNEGVESSKKVRALIKKPTNDEFSEFTELYTDDEGKTQVKMKLNIALKLVEKIENLSIDVQDEKGKGKEIPIKCGADLIDIGVDNDNLFNFIQELYLKVIKRNVTDNEVKN